MRLIEDVDATGGRKALRSAYIWYRFSVIITRDTLRFLRARPVPGTDDRGADLTGASNRTD